MSQHRMYHAPYAATALAFAMAVAAPVANASESWFPDLIFPETGSMPNTKAERVVTGSIPRSAGPTRQTDRSGTMRRETPRGVVSGTKEAEQ